MKIVQSFGHAAECAMVPHDNLCETADNAPVATTLLDIVALITADAATSPAEYLEETVVPHGGE